MVESELLLIFSCVLSPPYAFFGIALVYFHSRTLRSCMLASPYISAPCFLRLLPSAYSYFFPKLNDHLTLEFELRLCFNGLCVTLVVSEIRV